MSDVCKHCVQAGCLEVCPTGAIIRTEFDTVVIQSDVCNGCRACIGACPFGVIDINSASGTAQKCTLCYDRLAVGLEPATFGWLTSREQIWRFNWQNIPIYSGLLLGLILLYVAYVGFRRRSWGRAVVALLSALVVGGWSIAGAPGVEILPRPETRGFNLALIGVIVAAVWQMSGYTMALYLAGLRRIPIELREAARVDGASEFQLYRAVVLPLLKPITLSAMIILGHIRLKIFDLVFAMAGPDNARVSVPALLMYTTAFRGNQFAKGAAIAMILLVLVAAIIIPYLWSQLRSEVRK
jgi:glucose/mannose transport system permease protein